MDEILLMPQPGRAFRVVRPMPGEVTVTFPKQIGKTSIFVLVLGIAVVGLFLIPLIDALKSGDSISKYGYGLGAGVVMVGFGVVFIAGRRRVTITDLSVVHRMVLLGVPILTSEVARSEISDIKVEDEEGDYYVRIYPKAGPRIHIEDFASREERDWFLANLEEALQGPDRGFVAGAKS